MLFCSGGVGERSSSEIYPIIHSSNYPLHLMEPSEFREHCAAKLLTQAEPASRLHAFVGLDGFVDEIIHVVDKRESAESFQRLATISKFSERLAAAAGKSTNIELVNRRTKLGGNGPIMANALARFGINSTLGVAGLFDVADSWFGMKQHNDDFGLTLGHYGIYSGPYIMLPFLGPSTARDTVGLVVDGLMNPMSWLLPWYVTVPADVGSAAINAVNYRSLHPNQFEEADRYAVDLYGAVQDAYMQTRAAELKRLAQ